MKWSGGKEEEALGEDVDKVGEERRGGRRKRSKAEQEVRIGAGVRVERGEGKWLPSREEEGATLQGNRFQRLRKKKKIKPPPFLTQC